MFKITLLPIGCLILLCASGKFLGLNKIILRIRFQGVDLLPESPWKHFLKIPKFKS